jgi:short-subunit dehydrogenase involved in D-alanine esterification of teichoic acids
MATVQTRSLTGKAALITGGSKGIGAGIVRAWLLKGRMSLSPFRTLTKTLNCL